MLAAFSHLFHLEVLEVWPDTLEDCPMVYTLTLWQYTCCLHEHYTTFTSEIFQNIVLKSSDFLTILFCNFKKGIYEAIDGDLLDSDSLSKLNPYMVIKLCGSQLYISFSLLLPSLKPFVFWTTAKLERIMAVSKSNVCKATTRCFPWLHQWASPCKFQLHAGIVHLSLMWKPGNESFELWLLSNSLIFLL